jgi:two-component system response regulator NreC
VTDRIRVIIADDHTIVRSGVRLLLEAEPDIDVVGEALDGGEVMALVESLQPDVVLMDIAMPVMDGLEATRRIKKQFPKTQVLVLTMHRSDEYFFELIKAGASGYVLKGAKTSDLIEAVHVVSAGEVFLYPAMAHKLVQGYLNLVEWENEFGLSLSTREKEILRLLAEGYNNNEIAEKLYISPSTVHSHRSNIMNKLGLSSRRELLQYARQRGLIQG